MTVSFTVQNHSGELLSFLILQSSQLCQKVQYSSALCAWDMLTRSQVKIVRVHVYVYPSKFAWSLMPLAASSL